MLKTKDAVRGLRKKSWFSCVLACQMSSLVGWRPSLATRVEAIALRLEAMARKKKRRNKKVNSKIF